MDGPFIDALDHGMTGWCTFHRLLHGSDVSEAPDNGQKQSTTNQSACLGKSRGQLFP